MKLSVIMSSNCCYTQKCNWVFGQYRHKHSELIILHANNPFYDIRANKIIVVKDHKLSLMESYNLAAKSAHGEWLAFVEPNVYFKNNLTDYIDYGHDILVGRTMCDVRDIGMYEYSAEYKVDAAPLMVKRELFNDVGGFARSAGYVDSYAFGFPYVIDAGAIKVLSVFTEKYR